MTEPNRAPPRAARKRLGEVLVEQGVITGDQLEALLQRQRSGNGPRRRLGRMVVEEGFADDRGIAAALAASLRLPLLDLSRTRVDPAAARSIPRAMSERYGILVTANDGINPPNVAVIDPTDILAMDEMRMHLRRRDVHISVALEPELRRVLTRVWSVSEDSAAVHGLLDDFASNAVEVAPEETNDAVEDAPAVKLVDLLLGDAVSQGASDVHVETERDGVRVRFRVDGVLRDVMTAPKSAAASLISRLKILSGLDISERRRPQDGRARLSLAGRVVDTRVSTLPALWEEKVVMRILPQSEELPTLEQLGLDAPQLLLLRTAVRASQGLVLITGPTGAGKTSTLYAAIREITTPDKNLVTLEDPVEISLPGMTQVHVNVKAGLTFAAGLRSILRQDPDVILVGEIRDAETAEHAMAAAMTGHMVLSTLHTTSAVGAIARLADMGAESFMLAASLSLVVAQRLVRRVCRDCSAPAVPDDKTLTALGLAASDLPDTVRAGTGCDTCSGTGYRGRVGVYEMLPITPVIRSVLRSNGNEEQLSKAAESGGLRTLRTAALEKAANGSTTYEEVLRVTASDGLEDAPGDLAATVTWCPACSGGLTVDMQWCPQCAAPVGDVRCTSCNKSLQPLWRVCPWCRTPAPVPVVPAGPAPASPAPESTAPESPAPESAAPEPRTALGVAPVAEEARTPVLSPPLQPSVAFQRRPEHPFPPPQHAPLPQRRG